MGMADLQNYIYEEKTGLCDDPTFSGPYVGPVWSSEGGPNQADAILYTLTNGCPGRIGIGTKQPQADLDLRGSALFGYGLSGPHVHISNHNSSGVLESANGPLILNRASGQEVWVGSSAVPNTQLNVYGPIWAREMIASTVFNSNGLSNFNDLSTFNAPAAFNDAATFYAGVGIGTAPDPAYSLSVCGPIRTTEVKVEAASAWCDYVFEEDYGLASLEEVERFIVQYHHLPEIPSAKEVEAEGINVSQMMTLMMKKIEELTLYTIEQEKRIQELEANKH